MAFWHKDSTTIIRNELKKLGTKIKKLPDLEEKRRKSLAAVSKCKNLISDAKKDIMQRAEEHISKPWIDTKYDGMIKDQAEAEKRELDNLSTRLDEYEHMIKSQADHENLDAAIEILAEEDEEIDRREKLNEAALTSMENETLKSRLRQHSAKAPPIRTQDGVQWSKVTTVARQLGGFVVSSSGKHPYEIRFPSGTRPIPISADVGTERLAGQFRQQMQTSFPKHKVPKKTNIQTALKAGDIHRAA